MGKYHTTQDTNGTEDEILIHAPDGRGLAQITFWEAEGSQAKADAALIVDALNAYRPSLFEQLIQITKQHDEVVDRTTAAGNGKGVRNRFLDSLLVFLAGGG